MQGGLGGAQGPRLPGVDGGIHIGLHGRRLGQGLGALLLGGVGLFVGGWRGGVYAWVDLGLHAQAGIGTGQVAGNAGFGVGLHGRQLFAGGLVNMGLQLGSQRHGRQAAQGNLRLVVAVNGLHLGDLQLVLAGAVFVAALQPRHGDGLLCRPHDFIDRKGHDQFMQRQGELL